MPNDLDTLLNTTALTGEKGQHAPGAGPATDEDELLTRAETAAYLRVSLRALERMEETGEAPARVAVSVRRFVYRKSDVRAWVAMRTTRAKHAA